MSESSPTRNRLAGDGETPTAMGGGMDDEIVRLQHQLRLEGPPLERRALDARDPQPAFSAYSYEPTLRDRFASYLIGDRASSPEGRRLAEGLFGSIGMGHSSVGLHAAGVVPAIGSTPRPAQHAATSLLLERTPPALRELASPTPSRAKL